MEINTLYIILYIILYLLIGLLFSKPFSAYYYKVAGWRSELKYKVDTYGQKRATICLEDCVKIYSLIWSLFWPIGIFYHLYMVFISVSIKKQKSLKKQKELLEDREKELRKIMEELNA